ncbi:helix-turn-helix domain-containing protein [Sphingobium chlorophenolicum]
MIIGERESEKALVKEALRMNDGNVSSAARTLGITGAQLCSRLSKVNE